MGADDSRGPGGFRVQVAGTDHEVVVRPGDRILPAARRAGVWLPFECGWGTCGTCKVTLVEGEVEGLFPAAPAIDRRDERRRRILTCQSTPRSDVVIKALRVGEVEERPTRDHAAVLVESEELAPQVRRFRFRTDEPVSYRPGQYAILDLGPDLRRCYSMAGPPGGCTVDFIAKRYDGKPGSGRLFELEIGDEVPMELPYGDMWLRAGERPVVLTAGGTGVSAVLAIMHQLAASGSEREVHVLYGVNTEADLAAHDELCELAAKLPAAQAHAVLLRPSEAWTGRAGLVTDALADLLEGVDDAEHYFAGPPVMVDAVTALLRERGTSLDRVHYDRFG
ncbi:2Fe-2S iron-sulfur cluster binding domain-containing protein [Pseudonocardia sp. WMMC193]|uniref:2Fe-2S iron-sulfur cluster binding domain-containing protein n=1 Tax=Pseudonocardia sp. WMMC193 TaxID=2911965 RepID=UPI001F1D7C27|nr:2Fe-2S iron-sulfur cluster binding domain-containing protein [Pseudonocardia sp. WMMC193]MCF7550846.1 2Fe-2S iron-sulfur cluster binding domain-containing protein [Pseudonocardia sp. WMMC193]